eukprot:Opistho-1_new@26700
MQWLRPFAVLLVAAFVCAAAAPVEDKKKVAVLACDFIPDILGGFPAADQTRLLGVAARVLNASRAAGAVTIYTRVAFREGYPEVSERNLMFTQLSQKGLLRDGTPGAAITREIAPSEGDLVLTKTRVGAFSTTNLRTILDAHDITDIVLFGISTSGVILTTVREAADMDYSITVLSDACADHTDEVHSVLMGQVFPKQATVLTADEWIKSLAR